MQLTLIRNATLRLVYGGYRLLVDPYLAPQHSLPSFTGRSLNPMVALPMPADAVVAGMSATSRRAASRSLARVLALLLALLLGVLLVPPPAPAAAVEVEGDDVAAVAVAALTTPASENQAFDLTGGTGTIAAQLAALA